MDKETVKKELFGELGAKLSLLRYEYTTRGRLSNMSEKDEGYFLGYLDALKDALDLLEYSDD